MKRVKKKRVESEVIASFGKEWRKFNFNGKRYIESLNLQFDRYFHLVNLDLFSQKVSMAADFGAGSGRWTEFLLAKFDIIHVIEPSEEAFRILQLKFNDKSQVRFHNQTIISCNIEDASLDFAMSLGVIHHVDDPQSAICKIFETLKPGGIFLGYLYYKLENKPLHYNIIWRVSDTLRRIISSMPFFLKSAICDFIALIIYYPLARVSKFLNFLNFPTSNIPLHHYADLPLYMMRNDSLDRFGTIVEKRFSKVEISEMLIQAGAAKESIRFSEQEPHWTFVAIKAVH